MPSFLYEAVSRAGERVRGELVAQNRAEAFRQLDRDRLQPIKIQEKDGVTSSAQSVGQPRSLTKVRPLARSGYPFYRRAERLTRCGLAD